MEKYRVTTLNDTLELGYIETPIPKVLVKIIEEALNQFDESDKLTATPLLVDPNNFGIRFGIIEKNADNKLQLKYHVNITQV